MEAVRGRDARQRMVTVTASGRERLAAAKPRWRHAQAVIDTMLGEAGIARLHRDLDHLDELLRHHLGLAA